MMTTLLESRAALVIGAGRGIGRVMALGLADAEQVHQTTPIHPTRGTALIATADLADMPSRGLRQAPGS